MFRNRINNDSNRTLSMVANKSDILVNSRLWQILVIVSTILLLFGSEIRLLIFTKKSDLAFDILFLVGFTILIGDIIFRCIVFPDYFMLQFRSKSDSNDITEGSPQRTFPCSIMIGSFMFWCDLLSSTTLLYDVELIPWNHFKTQTNHLVVDLDTFLPIAGLESFREKPIEFRTELLIALLRTARVNRFIRASAVVKISSKINWYWIPTTIEFLISKLFCLRPKSTVPPAERRSDRQSRHLPSFACRKLCFSFRDENDDLQNDAAAKIQRAWRISNGYTSTNESLSALKFKSNKSSFVSLSNSIYQSPGRHDSNSQVGNAMRELTGQRVAVGIMIALVLTSLFTYQETDNALQSIMIVLHYATQNSTYATLTLETASKFLLTSKTVRLCEYTIFDEDNTVEKDFCADSDWNMLRDFEKLIIEVCTSQGNNSIECGEVKTLGKFDTSGFVRGLAYINLLFTISVLFIWFFGVTAFAGPVMTLVVKPIERMINLLSMLMKDPLGYQSTKGYNAFVLEEDELTRNTKWTKEVLKGMETSFLMSTILRIGSLMKVGFGSAGVEIIRNNLEKVSKKDIAFKNLGGSSVSCIFLFCDIRQFTDATECLQEEIFVFTNNIAAVVHTNCNSYGGSANKNVGDAFLLSWLLDSSDEDVNQVTLIARQNQAEKALYSVIKISIKLHDDDIFLESISDTARERLKKKYSKREGPIVQMGFGLHAGRAVQGAIGSQRKIDATYVSESVELAEFLESATKKYGVNLLMSCRFYNLLPRNCQWKCRKIDQILFKNEEEDDNQFADITDTDEVEKLDLYTFDMHIDALYDSTKIQGIPDKSSTHSTDGLLEKGGFQAPYVPNNDGNSSAHVREMKKKTNECMLRRSNNVKLKGGRRRSVFLGGRNSMDSSQSSLKLNETSVSTTSQEKIDSSTRDVKSRLQLPYGPSRYNSSIWHADDIKKIRHRYTDGIFFSMFNNGLKAYFVGDWKSAAENFKFILERFEDGPSRYFLSTIEENNLIPPRNFTGYGSA